MPYTPAHPITAVVLDKLFPKRFNKTGLVIGTIAPDLQNFVMLRPTDTDFGHSPLGMLTIGLPASVLIAFAFHRLVLPAMALHTPAPFNGLLYRYAAQGWTVSGAKAWIVLLLSIAIGMYSHLFLDGFTHKGGLMYPYTVAALQWLAPGLPPSSLVLQLFLSAGCIGLELLVLTVLVIRRLRWKNEAPAVHPAMKWSYWLIVLLAIFAVTATGIAVQDHGHLKAHAFMALPVAPLTGTAVGLVAASALHAWIGKRKTSAA
ncbi:DUF4184 family protein [Paenibacillus flagellatus]|nr:DUF4184 family protein [Paenibacillus flagellatus]